MSGNKNKLLRRIISFVLCITFIIGMFHYKELANIFKKNIHATENTVSDDIVITEDIDEFAEEISISDDDLESDTKYATKRLIVLSDNADFETYGASSVVAYDNIYILSYERESTCRIAHNKLLKDDTILSVEIDSIMETESNTESTNDVYDITSQSTSLNNYLSTFIPTKEVIVAILDTGIDNTTGFFDGRIIDSKINLSSSGDADSVYDDNGHGTEMATIIADNSNDYVKLLPIKIANKDGKATILNTYLGIKKAIEMNADVISISMNTVKSASSQILTNLINEATSNGIIVVVSAGNNHSDVKNIVPANIDSAIVVSAINNDGTLASYSNYGDTVDYCSYGTYNTKEGTSYSTAIVAGIISNLLSKDAGISALSNFAINVGEEQNYFGNGLLALTLPMIITDDSQGINEEKDKYSLGADIIDLDWKTLSTDELDAYLGNTEFEYIGYLISNLSAEDIQTLRDKSIIANTLVEVYELKKSENDTSFETKNTREVDFLEYSLERYNEIKDEMSISEWRMGNAGSWVMSFFDGAVAYKYQLSDNMINTSRWNSSADSWTNIIDIEDDLTVTRTQQYTDAEIVPSSFKPPKVDKVEITIAEARCHEWVFQYLDDGETKEKVGKAYSHISFGNDDGMLTYDMSISFTNYEQAKAGYHTKQETVKTFKWNSSLSPLSKNGTLNYDATEKKTLADDSEVEYYKNRANYYYLQYTNDEGTLVYNTTIDKPAYIKELTFNDKEIKSGQLTVYYNGVYKSGHAYSASDESTWDRDLLDLDVEDSFSIGKVSEDGKDSNGKTSKKAVGEHTLDTSKSVDKFTLQFSLMYGLGLKVYDDDSNVLVSQADVPNYMFGLEPNAGTIKFNKNGGTLISGKSTPDNKTIKYTTEKISLPNPGDYWTKKGYHIESGAKAWRVGSSSSTTYVTQTNDSTEAATTLKDELDLTNDDGNSVTLYANWKANSYSVVYHANSGTGSDVTQSCTYDKSGGYTYYTNSTTSFSKTGSVFDGWNTKADGSGTDVTPGASFTNLTSTNGGKIHLYAQWKRVSTTLKVKLNTYTSVGTNGTQTVLASNWKVTHTEYEDSSYSGEDKTGYSHDGDSTALQTNVNHTTVETIGTGRYKDTDTIPDPVAAQYTLTLNYGGGKDGSNNTSSTQKTNRAFDGWSYSEDTDKTGDWTHSTTTKSATFTHGLDDGKIATITATWTGSYKLTFPVVSNTGYVFLGWYYTDSSGNEQLYSTSNAGISIVMDSDKSFYAKWRRSATYLKVDLNVYETVGDNGTQTQLKNNWVVTHNQNIIDDTKHDAVSGNTTYTTTALTNHYEFVQVCKGAYTDTDTIPDPVPTQYTLTLNYGGGKDGSNNTSSTQKTNRAFDGWSYSEDTDKTGDWTHSTTTKSATFTHGLDDGKTATITATWTGSYKLTFPVVSRTGYVFLGWYYTDSSGNEKLYSTSNAGISIVMDSDKSFYAKWRRSATYLKVDLNVYETVGDNGTQTQLKNNWVVTHNQNIIDDTKHDAVSGNTTYTTTALTNHYEFVQVCKGAYTDTDTIPDPVPTQYTLTLDYANGWNVNGSQYEIDVDSLTRDTYSTISGSTYSAPNRSYKSKTDRTFNGWTYTEDTANTGDWTHSTTSKSGTFTHGADDEKTAYLTANWKGSYCLYLPKVERYGYTFLGWYDSNGVQYTDDNSGMYKIVMDENLNLTARWKLDTINIPVSVSWLDSNNEYTSRPPAIYFELYRSNAKSSSDNSTFTKSNAYILVTTTTANGTWGYNNFTKDDYDTDETNMPHNTIPVSGQPITGDNTNPTTINKWEYTILQLQKTNVETGVDYVYKLKEIECKSLDLTTEYGVSYDSGSDKYDYAKEKYYQISNQTQWTTQTVTDTYSWTNRLLNPYIGYDKNVTGTVTFVDADDKYHFRPYTMVIELYQNNPISRDDDSIGIRKLYDSVTLKSLYPYSSSDVSKFNTWIYAFYELPTIDEENCTKYSYDVVLTHDDERYRYTNEDWNDMYENKHINSTTYLQYDFVNNKKVVGDIYQSKSNGIASTKKDFLSIYGNSAYNLRYYYISEAKDLSVKIFTTSYSDTSYDTYTESLIWNFTATINSNSFVSPPVNYSGSNSPDDRTGVFNGTGIGNTDDDYTHTNNIVTFTNTVYNQGEETAQNADFNKINTKKKNEYFLLRLEQIQKSWSGSGDLITETYADDLWSGNSYNVIIPANGSITLEYLPDGKYEVYIYGNNDNDTDVKDADFDFWKMTQVSGSNITFSKELQSDGSYKYYIETSSEAETATATLKHWNKIHTWRGYVDDDIKNSTNLRTSDFATDVDFRNP